MFPVFNIECINETILRSCLPESYSDTDTHSIRNVCLTVKGSDYFNKQKKKKKRKSCNLVVRRGVKPATNCSWRFVVFFTTLGTLNLKPCCVVCTAVP